VFRSGTTVGLCSLYNSPLFEPRTGPVLLDDKRVQRREVKALFSPFVGKKLDTYVMNWRLPNHPNDRSAFASSIRRVRLTIM
jgi:hypothetical protein